MMFSSQGNIPKFKFIEFDENFSDDSRCLKKGTGNN